MQENDIYESEMYYERDPAAAAVDRLDALGYDRDEISVMMDDKTRERAFSSMVKAKGSEGVATGATAGGILGAIIAGLTATGSVVAVAGTGGLAAPLVVGPLAAVLAGLGVGAAGGGIVGGLIGVGIAEKKAKDYEKGLRKGGILIAVKPKAGTSSRRPLRVSESRSKSSGARTASPIRRRSALHSSDIGHFSTGCSIRGKAR